MHYYILVDKDQKTPLRHVVQALPLGEYYTRADSAVTGKPYYVPATMLDPPFDPATQVKTGPQLVYQAGADAGRIVYTVRDKTAAELEVEKDTLAGRMLQDKFIFALVRALNKGTFVPGSNYTASQIKAVVKAEL